MSTRDAILETTCALLELQGYHATGLNQIVKESGSPKGSLYHHFPGGKEALAAEAAQRVGDVVQERIRALLTLHEDASEAVAGFIHRVAVGVEESGYRAGAPITSLALETAATSERLRLTCDSIYRGWITAIGDRLQTGGIDAARADSLAHLSIAALEGAIILARTARSPQPLLTIADELAILIRSAY